MQTMKVLAENEEARKHVQVLRTYKRVYDLSAAVAGRVR